MQARKHAIGASIAILAASISAAWGADYAVEVKGCLTSEPAVIDKAGDVVIGTNDTRGVTDVSSTGPLNGKVTHECRVLWTATKAGVEGAGIFRVHTPLLRFSKAQIVAYGRNLRLDFSLTHTCYDPDPEGVACGRCDACVLRLKGFREAGLEDPIRYRRGGG